MIPNKILVVDDSDTIRSVAKNALKSMGYENILEAPNGKVAYEILEKEGADLILTDWNMPEMSGMEFVKTVRANPKFVSIPIIMMTTRGSSEDILDAFHEQVDDYLVKPFTPDDLKEKIDRVQ